MRYAQSERQKSNSCLESVGGKAFMRFAEKSKGQVHHQTAEGAAEVTKPFKHHRKRVVKRLREQAGHNMSERGRGNDRCGLGGDKLESPEDPGLGVGDDNRVRRFS